MATKISYVNLTSPLINRFSHIAHRPMYETFLEYPLPTSKLPPSRWDYSINFILVTKRGTSEFEIKGPSYSKRYKCCDYTFWLPDEIRDLSHYLDVFCQGINGLFPDYDIARFRSECQRKLSA